MQPTEITLKNPKVVTTVPATAAQTVTLSKVTVIMICDDGSMVFAQLKELQSPVVLWDKSTVPSYTDVGDYKKSQVLSRIEEVLK